MSKQSTEAIFEASPISEIFWSMRYSTSRADRSPDVELGEYRNGADAAVDAAGAAVDAAGAAVDAADAAGADVGAADGGLFLINFTGKFTGLLSIAKDLTALLKYFNISNNLFQESGSPVLHHKDLLKFAKALSKDQQDELWKIILETAREEAKGSSDCVSRFKDIIDWMYINNQECMIAKIFDCCNTNMYGSYLYTDLSFSSIMVHSIVIAISLFNSWTRSSDKKFFLFTKYFGFISSGFTDMLNQNVLMIDPLSDQLRTVLGRLNVKAAKICKLSKNRVVSNETLFKISTIISYLVKFYFIAIVSEDVLKGFS